MKPSPTDNNPLPQRWRNLLALTGLTQGQVHIVCTLAQQRLSTAPGRPWTLPVAVRVLLVLIHLRTNLTTRALAALFGTSQSTVDRVIHHLVPVLAGALQPTADNSDRPWIIDGTLIPVHDQSISAVSNNYRRSVNSQIIICAHRRRVLAASQCWPGNRNDVIVARHTVLPLLDGRVVLGDGGYRGITSITTPRRDRSGRIIRDDYYRAHRRLKARVEHVIARLKDWQILHQCRRRGHAINHSLQIVAGLWNLKAPDNNGSSLSQGATIFWSSRRRGRPRTGRMGYWSTGERRRTGSGPLTDARMKTSTSATTATRDAAPTVQPSFRPGAERVRQEPLGARPAQAREEVTRAHSEALAWPRLHDAPGGLRRLRDRRCPILRPSRKPVRARGPA
ncbi:transposase family protein [Mycobacterium branderi]|nr:transposase family protein [Mycobacterium branderi]MCV7234325.1 transposase [Mycobacterium branderi]